MSGGGVTDEMIEAAARALYAGGRAEYAELWSVSVSPSTQEHFRETARTALQAAEAVRPPDPRIAELEAENASLKALYEVRATAGARQEIRREALEEAASLAETYPSSSCMRKSTGDKIADRIRALIDKEAG
ncbi:MAG: hypothetical protein KI785_04465 [Devosiaceae bacterium]|nr:hypothetical protein [Devosiaceae bacterium MH13]